MREISFIVPLRDNDGKSLVKLHGDIRAALLDRFSGFSQSAVLGVWVNNATTYEDASIRYTVAADWTYSPKKYFILGLIAKARHEGRQEAIYWVDETGKVELY